MLTTLEIVEAIGNEAKTPELKAIENALSSLNEEETEIRKRYDALSDKKVLITLEITLKGITTFHSQVAIGLVETAEELQNILKSIDKHFLKEIILFALTYKSMSARDYKELLHYRKKYGSLY